MEKKRFNSSGILRLSPIMLVFFAVGFVDLAGIAANYVKKDFALSDPVTNMFTSMVFMWFLIGSVSTAILMNKIGRRKTVIWSLWVTFIALLLPLTADNLPIMALSFMLLGIGNTMMQVSLPPLLSDVVQRDKLTSAVTFGQFVKAIASFVAPMIAGWGAFYFQYWRFLYVIFLGEGLFAFWTLWFDKIKKDEAVAKGSSFNEN